MNWIRTTLNIPEELHEELRKRAFREKKSMGQVLYERLKPARKNSIDKQIEADFAFFKKVAKSGKQIDLLEALRKDRNRDNA